MDILLAPIRADVYGTQPEQLEDAAIIHKWGSVFSEFISFEIAGHFFAVYNLFATLVKF